MGINAYNYPLQTLNIRKPNAIDNYRKSMHGQYSATYPIENDSFISVSGNSNISEIKELERLFPDNEIYNIYNNIAAEYGLEYPPELKIINNQSVFDKGLYDAVNNTITLNLLDLSPNTVKYRLESGEKSWDSLDESGFTLKTDSNREIIDKNIAEIKRVGLNGQAVKLTDDDKRKVIIFTLAHELEHCYQHQQMDKTEGISSLDAIKQRCAKQMSKVNLVEKYLFMHNLEKNYRANNKKLPDKIYTANSPEGKQAIEWYNAKINYSSIKGDYSSYINNPLEVDANSRAHQYLIGHYGAFQGGGS